MEIPLFSKKGNLRVLKFLPVPSNAENLRACSHKLCQLGNKTRTITGEIPRKVWKIRK